MMPKPKKSKTKGNLDKQANRMSSERVLYESQPNMILYSDNFIFKIIILFFLVFMFSPILALVYRIQGTLQSNYQLQFINMTYIAELILFLCIIIIIVKLILDYLDWKNTLYTLTDKRILINRGLFNKEKISMPYTKVQDIDVSQSVLERLLGAGDIIIYGGHDNSETILDEVPNPREVEEIILNQVNSLNYAYNQSQPPRGYNDYENYANRSNQVEAGYDSNNHYGYNNEYNSRDNSGYDRGYDSRGYHSHNNSYDSDRSHNHDRNHNDNGTGYGLEDNDEYLQGSDEGYFEDYDHDSGKKDVSKNNSNTHYFNTNDTPEYSSIKGRNNNKNMEKSNKKFNKDDLVSLNKRKFKKS